MRNLKLAVRTLRQAPILTGVAVLSLALGIGANAAIFSVFDQLLRRPLPVPSPHELANLGAPGPKPGSNSCNNAGGCEEVLSYPMFRDLERLQTSFTGLAAHRSFDASLASREQTESGEGMLVSGSYFGTLGLTPAAGRLLGPDDDRTIGGHPVTVLSHAFWRRRFSQDPAVVNDTIAINGQLMTIVGVAPEGFDGTTLGSRPDVFVPITMRGLMQPTLQSNGFDDRRSYWIYAFGRLRPGVSIEQAGTELNAHYRPIVNDVEAPLQQGLSDQTMARFREKTLTVASGPRGQSSVHREARTPVLILFGVTGIVLLIACANIANLLLARGAGRAAEMAVRLSLGASRRQLVGQLLTESCLLAVAGGTAGLLVARWTLDVLASLLPPEGVATMNFGIDRPILLFTAALSLATGVLFGLFPAVHSTRPDLIATIRNQAGQPGGARSAARFRTVLATAQIALAMALLASAGLFVRSLFNVSRVDLGFRTDNLVMFGLAPQLNGYGPDRTRALFERLENELMATPGVVNVSTSLVPLLSGSNWGGGVSVQGFDAGPDTDVHANFSAVGPDYFHTIGVPVLSGREFTRADAGDAARIAIVNEAFARKFGLGRDAVGKRMSRQSGAPAAKLDLEIVGLVKDAKYSEVKDEVPPQFFTPIRQDPNLGFAFVYVRTAVAPESVLAGIPAIVRTLDANLPLLLPRTLEQQVRENVFLDRVVSMLSGGFAALATLLAAIGLYGVLAYTVAQRTREIGLRMALGANGARVRRMVLRQVGWMTLAGGLIGLAAAVAVGRFAGSLLYEMRGEDPIVLAASAILLTLVALGAGLVPAMRASRIDPMRALRYE